MRTEGFEPPTCWSGVRHATVAPCPLVIIINNDISFKAKKSFFRKLYHKNLIILLNEKNKLTI